MNEFMKAMLTAEHTEETWKRGWSLTDDRTASGPLSIQFVSIDDDGIVLEMPITDAARQPYGLLHGGVTMVLVESAASSHACWKHDLTQTVPVGIEINGSHLESAREGTVVATCTKIRGGEKLIVHDIKVHHKESGRLLNISRMTNLYIPSPVADAGEFASEG